MSGAREEILRRIRGALDDVPAEETPADVAVAREYRHAREMAGPALVDGCVLSNYVPAA